ncbi:hypothetical protein [Sinorhizobium meliloti]|nr:hypothetical protein [Sinorhizobium meliloti]
MQAIIGMWTKGPEEYDDEVAREAYRLANAMMAERRRIHEEESASA